MPPQTRPAISGAPERPRDDTSEPTHQSIGEYYADHKEQLLRDATAIAAAGIDPEDLLSDAILATFVRCQRGGSPTDNLRGYLRQVMRNRVIDLLRSPDRRVTPHPDPPALHYLDTAEHHAIESASEYRYLTAAMNRLPSDQALALRENVVAGLKPGQLAARMRRTSSGVYSLLYRAKASLRKEFLAQMTQDLRNRHGCLRRTTGARCQKCEDSALALVESLGGVGQRTRSQRALGSTSKKASSSRTATASVREVTPSLR